MMWQHYLIILSLLLLPPLACTVPALLAFVLFLKFSLAWQP